MTDLVVGLVIGVVVGAVVGVLVLRARSATVAARLADAREALARQAEELDRGRRELEVARTDAARLSARVEHQERAAAERAAAAEHEREVLRGSFAELSSQALQRNAEQFLTLADTRLREAQQAASGDLAKRQQAISQLLGPLHETLTKYEEGLRLLELDRQNAYATLTEQVKQLGTTNDRLQRETSNLVTALRAPQTRGRWGEVQLRRVVEMAGMVAHCDFTEQVSVATEDGQLRPDLLVHLPGGAQVVVDAKVPLDAFLKAAEAEGEDERKVQLLAHARQVRTHVDQLAKKQYWNQFDPTPDFVVAFVPGDPLLAAAFEHDPTLMEHAVDSRVLLTTPTSLIALLRTIAFGWQQEDLSANAREVQQLGADLYDRLRIMGGHLGRLHKSLTSSVEAYNDAVGSLESRVLVTARRFPELGVVGGGAQEIPETKAVSATPRSPQAPELLAPEEDPPAPLAVLPEPHEPPDAATG
jgi:DNA recombination protein RmuC